MRGPLMLLSITGLFACGTDEGGTGLGDSGKTDSATTDTGTTDSLPTGGDPNCLSVPEGVDLEMENAGFLYTRNAEDPVVFDLCIGLTSESIAALDAAPTEYAQGTLGFGGESWTVGVRLKGSPEGSFRTLEEKASFKIKMHEYDPEERFYGRKRLTLNSMIQDGSMVSEHGAYYLFEGAGLPAPMHGYSRVFVNGELFGLYGVVETMDEEFLERAFPGEADGNLYEGGYGADLYSHRQDNFAVQETIGDVEDRSDLIALIEAVEQAAEDGTTFTMLDTWFERDALLTLWAAELVLSNQDGYTTAGNNYMLYHPAVDALWVMTPWGPDQCFWRWEDSVAVEIHAELGGRIAADCRNDAECSAALDAKVADVLGVWESIDLSDYVDRTTYGIEAACREDPRSSWGDYGCAGAQEETRAWVAARPAIVRAELGL